MKSETQKHEERFRRAVDKVRPTLEEFADFLANPDHPITEINIFVRGYTVKFLAVPEISKEEA